MAQDLTGLYNLALSAVGSRESVSSPTEQSREAELCTIWYPHVRDQVLRAAPWGSARKNALLAILKERNYALDWADGDPEADWRFAYALPSDHLQPININGFQNFLISNHAGVPALVTNTEMARLTYTSRNIDIPQWDNDLFMAIAQALGAAISLNLHGKLPRKQEALQLANQLIAEARVRAANAQNHQYDSVPDWLMVRGVMGSVNPRFIYPNGPMLSWATLGGTP